MFRPLLHALLLALAAVVTLAQTPPAPEQVALDQRYETDVREKVEQPQQVALRRLSESYRLSLEAAFKRAAGQGLLDQAVALQNESKRFAESNSVPEIDEPGVTPEVAKLRGSWRTEMTRLSAVRAAALQPIQQAYVASLRILEKELTRGLKIDEAKAVRLKIEGLTGSAAPAVASVPATPRPAAAAPSGPAVVPFAQPAPKADLYASGNNNSTIFVNGKEIMKGVGRDVATKVRTNLREGDVITILQNGRFSDNFIWLAAISPTGDFLFETSLEWKCYRPAAAAKWWDIKNNKGEQAVEAIPEDSEYRHRVKRAAMATPLYHGTPPIHSVLQDGDAHQPMYFYHIVTRPDLLAKKVPADSIVPDLSLPWLGKNVHINAAKDGSRAVVVEKNEVKVGPPDPANPVSAIFRIGRGTLPCTIVFESLTKRSTFLRHEKWKLYLIDKVLPDAELCLVSPVVGTEGVTIAAAKIEKYHLVANANGALDFSETVQNESAVFYLEEVKGK